MKKVLTGKETDFIPIRNVNLNMIIGIEQNHTKYMLINKDDKSFFLLNSAHKNNYSIKDSVTYKSLNEYISKNPTDKIYTFESRFELFCWLAKEIPKFTEDYEEYDEYHSVM